MKRYLLFFRFCYKIWSNRRHFLISLYDTGSLSRGIRIDRFFEFSCFNCSKSQKNYYGLRRHNVYLVIYHYASFHLGSCMAILIYYRNFPKCTLWVQILMLHVIVSESLTGLHIKANWFKTYYACNYFEIIIFDFKSKVYI